MKVNIKTAVYIIFIVLCYAECGRCTMNDQSGNDWDDIWLLTMPEPTTVELNNLGGLGEELENQKWQMVATKHHQIHYQPSIDKRKAAEIYSRIDNLYNFLAQRSPAIPQTPIKVFLVPQETGRSRCTKISNAMRTGDMGDTFFMLASLMHEETHLFNFAFLNNKPQGWWAGEYSCIYFQQRMLWHGQGKDVKQEIKALLPNGPRCHLSEISGLGKQTFDEAVSVLYFLEEQYGQEKSIELRKALLADSQKTNGNSLSNQVFAEVLSKQLKQLDAEWRQFYGWSLSKTPKAQEAGDNRLKKRISYSTEQASVQNIVREMANRAELGYDWTKSQSNTGQLCRRWVRNVQIKDKPLEEALKEILNPVGLTYRLEGNVIVLYTK